MGDQSFFDDFRIIRLAIALGSEVSHIDLRLDRGCQYEEKENTEFDRGHGPDTMNLSSFLPIMKSRIFLFSLAGLFCGTIHADVKSAPAVEAATVKTDFIRFIESDQDASLQAAIASYVSPNGVIVDLIGAVHAARLPDMEERLMKQGFQWNKMEWLKAWDLPNEK